jgi:SNF2 family DNA or RNA helicase
VDDDGLSIFDEAVPLDFPLEVKTLTHFERSLKPSIREARLLVVPWIRSLGKLNMKVRTEGWRFTIPPITPVANAPGSPKPKLFDPEEGENAPERTRALRAPALPRSRTRLKPPSDSVALKERLLYLLQPPLESLFSGKQVTLPRQPYPYQLEGIAFLMPRSAALLADEMGLGKTMQTILALRLLFHGGLIHRALLVCPKPLVFNWARELRTWAADLPFEIIGGDADARQAAWRISNCPLKVVNYEILTRDAALVADERVSFDVVVLDEAQRIKNRESKTAEVVCSLNRSRSLALTGTPIENRSEDLINIFSFVDKERIPPATPTRQLPKLTSDCILRRTKDDVLSDLPAKTVRDAFLELTSAQRDSYLLAEKEGVVRLNSLGATITVQHVFELIMRLKQICNFDPLTGQSAKLEQLHADLAEVADSGRKAIVFSQWVGPLEILAKALTPFGPLQFHGQVPSRQRSAVLERFKNDPKKHVLLMSYGTGSVGLNLQFTNYVFLFDRWWNPAVEDQAINRAHRIGQKEPVFVTRFVTPGTIESRIADILERKRQLFSDLLEQNGPPPSLGLSEEEIFSLFDIQVRPKRVAA